MIIAKRINTYKPSRQSLCCFFWGEKNVKKSTQPEKEKKCLEHSLLNHFSFAHNVIVKSFSSTRTKIIMDVIDLGIGLVRYLPR